MKSTVYQFGFWKYWNLGFGGNVCLKTQTKINLFSSTRRLFSAIFVRWTQKYIVPEVLVYFRFHRIHLA